MKAKTLKRNLESQLVTITIVIFLIIIVSLGILLPRVLLPVYEKNIYKYLKQPLGFVDYNKDEDIGTEVGYIFIQANDDDTIQVSRNFNKVIAKPNYEAILKNITGPEGKFKYMGNTYYYSASKDYELTKIAITNDAYINEIKRDILYTMFPVLFFTLVIISLLLVLWSRRLVTKIEKLKEKVDNIDNDDYDHSIDMIIDDEIKTLAQAIENMRISLKQQEEYKNQMYQNISHDFKTPLTVIKSYIEAVDDGIETKEQALKVIDEQTKKLEHKVRSLLYLNKLDYIKDQNTYTNELCSVQEVIENSVEKFKIGRPEIKWTVKYDKKNILFRGTPDMWEAIVDNLFANFMRYTKDEIRVTIKNNKIIFFNNGPHIDEGLASNIFTPYMKGINGEFGLGLSIVQKTVAMFGYKITVKNMKDGVRFTID